MISRIQSSKPPTPSTVSSRACEQLQGLTMCKRNIRHAAWVLRSWLGSCEWKRNTAMCLPFAKCQGQEQVEQLIQLMRKKNAPQTTQREGQREGGAKRHTAQHNTTRPQHTTHKAQNTKKKQTHNTRNTTQNTQHAARNTKHNSSTKSGTHVNT